MDAATKKEIEGICDAIDRLALLAGDRCNEALDAISRHCLQRAIPPGGDLSESWIGRVDRYATECVCSAFGVSEEHLRGRRRTEAISLSRFAAWAILHQIAGLPHKRIASLWNWDYSTIRYGIRRSYSFAAIGMFYPPAFEAAKAQFRAKMIGGGK